MKPLTTTDLLQKAAFREQVYFRWFKPEIEGQRDSAWRVKAQGYLPVSVLKRVKVRKHSGKHLFTIGEFSFDDYHLIEEGHEIDGHGHVFFFNDASQADEFVEFRKQKFARECASLRPAIERTLNNVSQSFWRGVGDRGE
jgi:hypothetical protein